MYKSGFLEETNIRDNVQLILNEAAQSIDDATHEVHSWAKPIAYLLECLEFHAMANDPHHPELFELMLTRLQERIATRLKERSW